MKSKKPSIPKPPKDQKFPGLQEEISGQIGLGNRLTSFDFTGDLAPLADVISIDDATTAKFLAGLQNQLDPIFQDKLTSIKNELAANNQLESSVANTSFGELGEAYSRDLFNQSNQFQLAQIDRALENRIRLLGAGIGVRQTGAGLAGGYEDRRNNFALNNYQNQMAYALANQKEQSGGLFGGLLGGAGGAIAGGLLAAPTGGMSIGMGALLGGLGGGTLGAFGPQGTGGSLFSAGAGLAGSRLPTRVPARTGMSSASINPLGMERPNMFDRSAFNLMAGL